MGHSTDDLDATNTDSGQRFLRTEDAARLIGMSPMTLNKLRSVGGGPAFRTLGRRCVVYDRIDLLEWVLSRPKQTSTSVR
jgi:predicted DNA-binding transcriptional regulator AlpA